MQAATLRICTDEKSHLPFITPNGEGASDVLIREAAREAGIQVEWHGAPVTRCREEIRNDVADAFPAAPYTPSIVPFMCFPTNGKEADPARAVMTTRAMVYRRVGNNVSWDGKQFHGLSSQALIPFGSVLLYDRLTAMNIPFDDKGKSLGANFTKLLAGRGDIAIGSEFTGNVLLADPQYAGRIEVLPIHFSDEAYYLALARKFCDKYPDQVEKLWQAIGRIRKTPVYQEVLRKATAEAALTLKE